MKKISGRFSPGALMALGLGAAVLAGGCAGGRGEAQYQTGNFEIVQAADTAMGTIVSQKIIADSSEQGVAVTEEIQDELLSLEERLLSWRLETSEVYRINLASRQTVEARGTDAGGTVERAAGMEISDTMKEILKRCTELSVDSDGAFDVTIGALVQLWNIDAQSAQEGESDELPSGREVEAALKSCGYEKLSLQGNSLMLEDGVQLDLGAVGKGIALDEIRGILEKEGVHGAIISVGGSVVTYGSKADGTAWNVAVVNPLEPSESIGYLSLPGGYCVSTSGDYERYVEVDGVRYAHILDPHTGYPPKTSVRSVTILAKDGLLSDALSTACFLLGSEEGMALAEKYGVDALFVDNEGNLTMTEGMEACFHRAP